MMAAAPPKTYYAILEKDASFVDLDASGDLIVDGTATLTGAAAAPAGITADVIGDVTGDVTGDVAGNTVGEHRHSTQELTASGAVTINSGVLKLNHASTIIAATLDAPTAGDELFIINNSASGTAAHTVTVPGGVTWDGTNTIATLNAPDESLHVVAISATRWQIMANNGTVAFS